MMTGNEILEVYESVALITQNMLTAAKDQNWEQLERLEEACSSRIECLKANDDLVTLEPALRSRKVDLIKKILATDKEIREITEPWLAQLNALMRNTQTSLKVNHAYGVGNGA